MVKSFLFFVFTGKLYIFFRLQFFAYGHSNKVRAIYLQRIQRFAVMAGTLQKCGNGVWLDGPAAAKYDPMQPGQWTTGGIHNFNG